MQTLSLARSSKVWKRFNDSYATSNYQGHLVTCRPQGACLTASCIVNQKHTYLFFGQPKRAHTLAPVLPEPCPSSGTKKGLSYLCLGGVRRPESRSLTLYPGQGMKRISNTAGARILRQKWEAKAAQPTPKLLNSILLFRQA